MEEGPKSDKEVEKKCQKNEMAQRWKEGRKKENMEERKQRRKKIKQE